MPVQELRAEAAVGYSRTRRHPFSATLRTCVLQAPWLPQQCYTFKTQIKQIVPILASLCLWLTESLPSSTLSSSRARGKPSRESTMFRRRGGAFWARMHARMVCFLGGRVLASDSNRARNPLDLPLTSSEVTEPLSSEGSRLRLTVTARTAAGGVETVHESC
jgi:hypothetical protein